MPNLRSSVNFGRTCGLSGRPLIFSARASQALPNELEGDARRVSETNCADGETPGVEQLPVARNREEIIDGVETVVVAAESESAIIEVARPRTHGRAMPR